MKCDELTVNGKPYCFGSNCDILYPKEIAMQEIDRLVKRINILTETIKEIDAMPFVAKINGRPF